MFRGHKRGKGNAELTNFLGERCMEIDVNSMKPLDNLCHPTSVIKEAEDLAADAFGSAHSIFYDKWNNIFGADNDTFVLQAGRKNSFTKKCS